MNQEELELFNGLVARNVVQSFFADYAAAVDGQHWSLFSTSLFTLDAHLDYTNYIAGFRLRNHGGISDVLPLLRNSFSLHQATQHHLSNITVARAESDLIVGTSYLLNTQCAFGFVYQVAADYYVELVNDGTSSTWKCKNLVLKQRGPLFFSISLEMIFGICGLFIGYKYLF